MFETTDITWDADGNYLYYTGTREFSPLISQIEFNFATNRGQDIYALALRKGVKNPFPTESDEVTISKEGDKPKSEEKKDEKKEEKKKEYIKIDFDGLVDRVTRVPWERITTSADGYEDYLVYVKGVRSFTGGSLIRRQACSLFVQGPQGKYAGGKHSGLCDFLRWEESARTSRPRVQAV